MDPEAKKRFRKPLIILVIIFIVAGVAAVPAWYAYKELETRQAVSKAHNYLVEGDREAAMAEASKAYLNDPEDLEVLRLIAEVYDGVETEHAARFWKQAFEISGERSDLINATRASIASGNIETAEELLKEMEARDIIGTNYHLFRGQVAFAKQDFQGALLAARRAIMTEHPDMRAHQFYVELTQLSRDPDIQQEGIAHLWELSTRRDELGLGALRRLAGSPNLTQKNTEDIIRLIRAHPEVVRDDEMLALQLELKLPGANEELILTRAIQYFNTDSPSEVLELGRWFNQMGQPAHTLEIISEEEAMRREDLLLVRLDALAQLGRWDEIGVVLQNPRAPIKEEFVRQFFLSRVQFETGQLAKAQISWQRAVLAAGDDPEALWYLARKADILGLREEAIVALNKLANIRTERRKAYDALLNYYKSDTQQLAATLQKMAQAFPEDRSVLNDWAYVHLLLKEQVPLAVSTARENLIQDKSYLARYITLALGYLRMGEFEAAQELLQSLPIDWNKAVPRYRAIYAVVLFANGQDEQANALLNQLDTSTLLPEERELLQQAIISQ